MPYGATWGWISNCSPSDLVERFFGVSTVIEGNTDETGETMAAKKKAKKGSGELIISKSRTKGATKKCNVSSDFYGALDKAVRGMIADAESRALGNKRKTLKPVDL
jgi:hypothetical protein